MLVNAWTGKPLPVYGDGLNVRDWLYVEDHCRAVERMLRGRAGSGETYNVGGGNEWTQSRPGARCSAGWWTRRSPPIPALAVRFPDARGRTGRPTATLMTFVQDRPGHDRRYAIDASKIEPRAGLRAGGSRSETGLRRTVAWYLEHEAWWRAVMDGSYRAWLAWQYETRGAS